MVCRVGTGASDEVRKQVHAKLKPLLIPADPDYRRKNNQPRCYRVTGNSKERPDVWISDPYQSLVFEVPLPHRLVESQSSSVLQQTPQGISIGTGVFCAVVPSMQWSTRCSARRRAPLYKVHWAPKGRVGADPGRRETHHV